MKKLIIIIILCFAYYVTISANDALIGHTDPTEQVEQKIHKFRIGADYGFALPSLGSFHLAEPFGKSLMGFAEYNSTKKSYIFSEFIYCGYTPDRNLVLSEAYGDNPWPDESKIEYKADDPFRVYSYVLGYGYRTNYDYARPAWRIGVGTVFTYTIKDKLTVTNAVDTLSFPAECSSSLGLDLMYGFDVPLFSDVFGFFSTINISTEIIGTKIGFKMQYTSLSFLGLYYRFDINRVWEQMK